MNAIQGIVAWGGHRHSGQRHDNRAERRPDKRYRLKESHHSDQRQT
jgi:hypothetical protein